MKKLILVIIAGFLLLPLSFAQKKYVWNYYNLQITVPDDFSVIKNTNTDFEMKGDGMELMMYLFEENISIEELQQATIEGATAMELDEIDEATPVQVNELQGYYVEGYLEGFRVIFAGLGDPKTQVNFVITIMFDDSDDVAEADALHILESLDILD